MMGTMWHKLVGNTAIRRVALALAVLVVALAGAMLGIVVGGRTETDVGPFRAEMQISPSVRGDTDVQIPPLGAVRLDSHDGPAHLSVRLGALDQGRTQALVNDPNGISRASESAVTDVESGLTRLVLRTAGSAMLGAMLLAALVFRRMRRVAWAGGLSLAIVLSTLAVAAGTFRPRSIEEPHYDGMLAYAPAVVGDAQRIANRYDEYRAQLQKMVRNVGRLYTTVNGLPTFDPDEDPGSIRVLHVSDLHLNPAAWGVIKTAVESFRIDVIVDTGDITDWGTEQEAAYYVSSIASLGVPYVFIRGNHDSALIAAAVARAPNAIVLENGVLTVHGLTFAGIGDPRFTPDKETSPPGSGDSAQTIGDVVGAGFRLATTIRQSRQQVDVALVHDPGSAPPLTGQVPIILAGHTHKRDVRELSVPDAPPTDPKSLLMVEGSTGGAGLRGLEPEKPVPLSLSVLYFDENRTLKAYDDIAVGGTGTAEMNLQRHVIAPPVEPASEPSTGGG